MTEPQPHVNTCT